MVIPPKPQNESERLQTLYGLGILDSEPDAYLDEVVALVGDICNTPVALVSLVDENRQWFKAKTGLDATETSRDVAFCAHAILDDHILQVDNALEDTRFDDNPLVTGAPHIRFYAGAPLEMSDGNAIGTLCAIDFAPRSLSDNQRQALNTLAHSVVHYLELQKSFRELQQKNALLEKANQYRQHFLKSMSHQLRTPLNSILGFSRRLFKSRDNPISNEKLRVASETIAVAAESLNVEMDHLFAVAQLHYEAPQLSLENVAVSECFQRLEKLFSPVFQHRQIKLAFTLEPDMTVQTDPHYLHLTLSCLIQDALKRLEYLQNVDLSVCVKERNLVFTLSAITSLEKTPDVLRNDAIIIHKTLYDGNDLQVAQRLAATISGEVELAPENSNSLRWTLAIPQ